MVGKRWRGEDEEGGGEKREGKGEKGRRVIKRTKGKRREEEEKEIRDI